MSNQSNAAAEPNFPLPPRPEVSDARLRANRENAQKSVGPRTEAGKAVSCLNAIKTGLTGNTVLFANDDHIKYYTHISNYEKLYSPVGPEETALVQAIADHRWRLNKIPGLELAILALGTPQVIENHPHCAAPEGASALEVLLRRNHEKELRNLSLHENRIARRCDRDIARLERLQAQRREQEEAALAEAAKFQTLADHHKQAVHPADVPGVGFVFSESRFTTYMKRLTPAQKQKFLQEALAEAGEAPQTQQAVA
jgi:hypothetical protein